LHQAGEGLRERGDYEGYVRGTSLYTQATIHPVLASVAAIGAGLALAMLMRSSKSEWESRREERSSVR
jgi:hypothetical protein